MPGKADAEMFVDLRLALRKLKEDIREASKMIKEGLGQALNIGEVQEKATEKKAIGQERLANKVKRTTSALKEQLEAWKKIHAGGVAPGMKITDVSGSSSTGRSGFISAAANYSPLGPRTPAWISRMYMGKSPPIIPPPVIPQSPAGAGPVPPKDSAMFWRRMLTGAMASMRGTGYGQIIAGNQFYGAFGQTTSGARAMGAVGLSGAGGAMAATGALMVALLAVTGAIKALQTTLKESIAAAERARELYAKSLNSGLGLQMTAQRSMTANVLGVSEDDIYKFGSALEFVQPRIKDAARLQAETATALAPLAYEMKIFKLEVESLFAAIAVDVVPALRLFVNFLDELFKQLKSLYEFVKIFAEEMAKAMFPGANGDKVKNTFGAVAGAIAMTILGPFATALQKAIIDSNKSLSSPQPFMKQMPASTWERMGLVATMHGAGMMDYARRTAVATERTAQEIQKLHSSVPRGNQSFGLDPAVSNP